MDHFGNAKAIRLKSHHKKYLLAEEDEESVSQHRNGSSKTAKWSVEFIHGGDFIRLKSCFGKYLTASNEPFLLGMTGRKVLQTLPQILDSSIEWEPIRDGVQIKLKTRHGNYLRANGRLPPWRNSVTHDVPLRTSTHDWILWDVDILDIQQLKPPPAPVVVFEASSRGSEDLKSSPQSDSDSDSDGEVYFSSVTKNSEERETRLGGHVGSETSRSGSERMKKKEEEDQLVATIAPSGGDCENSNGYEHEFEATSSPDHMSDKQCLSVTPLSSENSYGSKNRDEAAATTEISDNQQQQQQQQQAESVPLSSEVSGHHEHHSETRTPEIADKKEHIVWAPPTVQPTSWKSCCGLFDVFMGAH